jgi:quinol monooxygenase YgiN
VFGPAARIHYGTAVDDQAVVVFASFRPIAGKETELQDLLSWMVGHTRAEPGCERYELYRKQEDGDTFHLFERYRDGEALAAHRASDHYVEYRRRVADLLDAPIDVLVLDSLDAR